MTDEEIDREALEEGQTMSEPTIEEIEKRWPFAFPLDHTKGELSDAVITANCHIDRLIQKVKELELTLECCQAAAIKNMAFNEGKIQSLEASLASSRDQIICLDEIKARQTKRINELMDSVAKEEERAKVLEDGVKLIFDMG